MEVLRNHYQSLIMKNINEKGGKVTQPEDIWDNLSYLAIEVTKYDTKLSYLPIQIKKILAYIMDPRYRIEYSVNKTDQYCEVEARFYWSDMDVPAGIGFKKMYVNQIKPSEMISTEERESALEATCRGGAASRALTDGGIGMEFYGDSFDFDFEKEEAEAIVAEKATETVPQIPSAEEKKLAAMQKKAAKEAKVAEQPALPPILDVEESTEEEVVDAPTATVAPTTAKTPSISIEDAKNVIVDMGTFAGNPLGKVLEVQPRNLIWLINKNSAVSEEAKVLVETIPELKKYL